MLLTALTEPSVVDSPLIISKTWESSHSADMLNSRGAVNVPRDNGVVVAVLDARDVDGGAFEVLESDLKYAVRLGGVVDLSTIGLDCDYAAGGFFDGVIYAYKAEEKFYRILV